MISIKARLPWFLMIVSPRPINTSLGCTIEKNDDCSELLRRCSACCVSCCRRCRSLPSSSREGEQIVDCLIVLERRLYESIGHGQWSDLHYIASMKLDKRCPAFLVVFTGHGTYAR
jgi:hypothetical protein